MLLCFDSVLKILISFALWLCILRELDDVTQPSDGGWWMSGSGLWSGDSLCCVMVSIVLNAYLFRF